MRTFTTNNTPQRRGFTFAEIMLVILILALAAGLSGNYYRQAHKRNVLKAAAGSLMLMGKYARMYAIEEGSCQLYLDDVQKQFYLIAPVFDAASQTAKPAVVSNPYCRRTSLASDIEFEHIDVQPLTGENEAGGNSEKCITFYPNGSCDSAVIQIGNGQHSLTALFSPACAKISVFEGAVEDVETGMQAIDLDKAD